MKREDRKFFQNYSPPTHLYILFDFLCLRSTGTFPKDLSDPLFKLHVHFILLKKNPGLILQCDINVKWRPRPSWNAVHARRVYKKIKFQFKLVGWLDNITMMKRWLLLEIVCRRPIKHDGLLLHFEDCEGYLAAEVPPTCITFSFAQNSSVTLQGFPLSCFQVTSDTRNTPPLLLRHNQLQLHIAPIYSQGPITRYHKG